MVKWLQWKENWVKVNTQSAQSAIKQIFFVVLRISFESPAKRDDFITQPIKVSLRPACDDDFYASGGFSRSSAQIFNEKSHPLCAETSNWIQPNVETLSSVKIPPIDYRHPRKNKRRENFHGKGELSSTRSKLDWNMSQKSSSFLVSASSRITHRKCEYIEDNRRMAERTK